MRGNPELSAWGAEALAAARATFVGSDHIRTVLREVCGHTDDVLEVPPGVDIDEWVPEPRDVALAALLEEARRDRPNPGNAEERLPDEGNADRLERFLAPGEPVVVYFGKLIEQKGVHVLIEALAGLDARLVVVGFGPERAALEALAADRGVEALFTGPLEHRHLRHLLALADACVVPSIFPEAFGMVAAEAAAAGCPPLVARHSGLAEVAVGLEEAYPPELRHLAAFDTGDAQDLARRLGELLALPAADRASDPGCCPHRGGRALELGGRLAPAARAVRLRSSGKSLSKVQHRLRFHAPWATSSAFRQISSSETPVSASRKRPTSPSQSRKSSRCSTRSRSISSTASRTCRRPRPAPRPSGTSPGS